MTKILQMVIPLLALAACAPIQRVDLPLPSNWNQTLYYARRDVEAGNYYAADRILDEFQRTHPGTPEGREIAFWRAAYLIDPANERGSLTGGIAALDAYVAADSAGLYREQATVLRRTAAVAQGIADTAIFANKSRDEQIALLKDQLAKSKDDLAKANAELDRIKKRLANPAN
jgi:hypothetical protein